MKRFLIIIMILSILSSLAFAKLSDETQELVEDLRWKHYGYGSLTCLDCVSFVNDTAISWSGYTWSFWFKDGKLFVETQDGKWFIKMEKVKGGEKNE